MRPQLDLNHRSERHGTPLLLASRKVYYTLRSSMLIDIVPPKIPPPPPTSAIFSGRALQIGWARLPIKLLHMIFDFLLEMTKGISKFGMTAVSRRWYHIESSWWQECILNVLHRLKRSFYTGRAGLRMGVLVLSSTVDSRLL
ncbi:hypothetical protein CROQUDRAFT_96377 [Cronartium quercuum f. sp. fusiforme G11]|uniref:F-box domain-containing protein n=1 Tax=Cronartium quercuum f. sp. fusiforme G11 TaxID=708437 RepID=A0A9P6T990_9BASI|nr:hypothetical protein CROQUDRAFT_96377 [Cronartium quercuum f. sp. fusiforme G11]